MRVSAQDRFLGKQDILILGAGLTVAPERQVVPKDIATIVSTFLQAPNAPAGDPPPFSPETIVRGTLRGPGAGGGIELTAPPNTPFTIPPLSVPGIYTLEDIRLETAGDVLLRGTPESVTIEVIEKLLVTQVTARALTAQEIREKGIVFDKSSFQAYDFTAAFAVQDTPVQIKFPVVLPTLQGAQNVSTTDVGLAVVQPPSLPELKTIIPDTLRLQTQIPNLQVVGFTLQVPQLQGRNLIVPPIPGVVVIPGDIGFLDQFFSVMLMVGNVAPVGSNLVVSDLTGSIVLPPGADTVVGSGDDPLRMAQTTSGESPRVQTVVQPGVDGKLGTADDVPTLGPGETGRAEYLVEGRREGTHVIEFAIAGTLHGLPGGPVQVTGRAAGSVLVRNPTFTLTFTHPDTVAAGERYSLDVTVTNTSTSPANFVSVNLFSQHVSGATVVGSPSQQIESIPANDSATVSFDLVSRVTGKVTAATLDSDDNVQGRFSLKTSVGELGVPVSPDSLVLPSQASALPADVRNAALGLLGKAWAVATAPAAALPPNVSRFSKQIVFDRAVDVAEAGLRITLQEPIADSVAQLEMDMIGSDVGRLPAKYPNADDLAFAQRDFDGFDALRRESVRGDAWAAAVASLLGAEVASNGVAAFHQAFAQEMAYRPPQLSVVIGSSAGPLPFTISLVDAEGRRIGRVDANNKIVKEIPYSDLLNFTTGGAITAQMILLAAPETGEYHLQFDAVVNVPPDSPFDVSIVVPDGAGGQRQIVYTNITAGASPTSAFGASDPYRVLIDLPVAAASSTGAATASIAPIVRPAPHVISAVQQANVDLLSCSAASAESTLSGAHTGLQAGRVIALLFSEEVTPASVQDRVAAADITNYLIAGNDVVGVALQPGGRVAFLALRDPIGPFVPREITVSGISGLGGAAMTSQTIAIQSTVTDAAALVSGQVLYADGTPVPFATVRLLINPCDAVGANAQGISSKSADANGRFSWDYVVQGGVARIVAVDPSTDDSRSLDFTSQRNGQQLNVNVVFLGRGTLKGRTLAENGPPIAGAQLRITSLTDQSQYAATSDALGQFAVARVPVGNVFIEAVNVKVDAEGHLLANAKGTASELIPIAGATTTRDITLFDFIAPKITVKFGTLTGHVLRGDGTSAIADAPVVAYYQSQSQPNVNCPGNPAPLECAVGVERTDGGGAFTMANLTAGQYRLVTFDQPTFQQGEARAGVPADGSASVNILLSQGLGTVEGVVLDGNGSPVPDARVGGGLSLTTVDAAGRFALRDVPVGHREIVAVSDALGSKGSAFIDIVQAGQTVNAAIVLQSTGSIAGTVFEANGTTPVPNNKVYVFYQAEGGIQVVASTATDAGGHFSVAKLPLRDDYVVSAFRSDFRDGNVKRVPLKFNNQVARGDVAFRGSGGHVVGSVLDADGTTPLRAAVGISGDQVVVAGGIVGAGFQYVPNFAVAETNFTTGEYRFDGVWAGPFTLAAAGQFSPDPIAFDGTMPSAGATVRVDLRLQPTSQIAGTVFQPDGVTPVGRDVIVRFKSNAFKVVCTVDDCEDIPQGIQEETVVTDDAGRYLLPLVNAGRFTLTAEDPVTGKIAQVGGDVKPGQTGEFPIRLLGISALTIQVRGSDATTPIPGARVEVTQIAYPKKSVTAIADGSGTLVLNGGDAFSEGELIVVATDLRNGFAGRASAKVVHDGETVTVNVFLYNQSGTVFGTVYRSDGLTPVPNAEVVISNNGAALAFALTDAAGGYRQDLIPLGEFSLDVFEAATARRGFASGRIDLDRQQVPVNVVEAARGLVTGTAVDAITLEPIKNAEVYLFQSAPGGRGLPALQTTSGVDGTFSFPGATVGTFTIRVDKVPFLPSDPYGFGTAQAELHDEGERVDVPTLVQMHRREFGRVEGTVINADGTPAANIAVAVCGPGCASSAAEQGAVTAADGSFSIDHVLVGRFLIRAQSQVDANAAHGSGQLLFDGDIARTTLTLAGVSRVSGSVVFADNRPAANASVTLSGSPSSGCAFGPCTTFADASGQFAFINVPARTFTVTAVDPVTGLRGVAAGALNPGADASVRVVLQATASITGRTVLTGGAPAAAVTVDAVLNANGTLTHFFTSTDQNGQFAFAALPIGAYTAGFEDPIGAGVASRAFQANGPVSLDDIVLDDAPPVVATVTPVPSAAGVPRDAVVRIVFSEPVDASTVNQANVTLSGPAGTVVGTLQLSNGDTTISFTPVAALADQTRYGLTVKSVKDRVGKTMTAAFTSLFTTVDVTPPAVAELSPAANASGVPIVSTVRVKFSEPVDVAQFRGPPIALRKGAVAIAGRVDYVFGTTIVFTPLVPLDGDAQYIVEIAPAADLAGNIQPTGTTFTFSTTDRTAPTIQALVADGSGTVIENAVARVVADVSATHDIALVDFFLNGQPALAAHAAPFALSFQALPTLGKPGDQIKIEALATDTSGNRSAAPAVLFMPIVADQPPTVTIAAPADGISARNGDRVDVTVRTTDDLGVTQIGYRAQTGKPQDAATRSIAPSSQDRTETFAFLVPATAAPGSAITINASAVDTKGQIASATPIHVRVLDATPPVVTITGTTTGNRVTPGQQTNVVVSAQDVGGIAALTFTASGVVSASETRAVTPAQPSVAAAFAITVPQSAHAGDVLALDATATDAAGNVASAARVLLPIADVAAPTIHLRTVSGSLDLVPGSAVGVVAESDDDTAVASIAIAGAGAFAVSDAKQISPPTNSAQAAFQINVPALAPIGSVLTLTGTATDVFGNVSAPATLALTVKSVADVTLPPSVLLSAGESVPLVVQLSTPAPASGLRVDLATADPNVAQVTGSIQFAAGETTKPATVSGVTGGVVSLTASVGGVARATMTVTVRGAIVTGTVLNPQLQPVGGVEVEVTSAGLTSTTTTDGSGAFSLAGVGSGASNAFTLKAHDPATGLVGAVNGTFNARNGFAHVTVILLSAGSIGGTVLRADAQTPAGSGARVDIFASTDLQHAIASTFTDVGGAYDFPLVSLGTYTIEASDTNGNRGRSASVALTSSGQRVDVPVTYLGRGSVSGRVLDASNNLQPNVPISFTSSSIFGDAPALATNALGDGTFRIDNVFVGSFTVQAHDPITNLVGTASGNIVQDQQVVAVDVKLGTWSGLQGTVLRSDGATPVPNAGVTVQVSAGASSGSFATKTDADGRYAFAFLPLGSYVLSVSDPPTRGLGRATGSLTTHGQTVTQNVTLFGQGAMLVTVTDAADVPLAGARVSIGTNNGQVSDSLAGDTGGDGTVLIEHVLAGNVSVFASAIGGSGTASTTLAAGETRSITVALRPTASIAGTVWLADGLTPAVGSVRLCDFGCPPVAIASDGSYRFDNLQLGTYTVTALEPQGRKRAVVKDVQLTSNGQVAIANLTFVGVGTVTGRVLNPDNSSAPNLDVTIHSVNPDFGAFYSARTDAAGFYRAENVIVGPIAVSTGDAARGLLGEAAGTLAHDGDTIAIDVLLKNNAITLPAAARFDGNAFPWEIQKDAVIALGYNRVFAPSINSPTFGAMHLDVIAQGVATRFTGANIGTTEASGREIAVTQTGVAGLNVTRKVLVSSTYFARYLELLTNPTAAPITVDVRVQSVTRGTAIDTTSSGDTALTVSDPQNPDRWATLATGPDVDPFTTSSQFVWPQLAFVFDGPGAAQRASSATFGPDDVGLNDFGYTWSSVTVPSGATVALMHFGVQQYGMAAARAAATRLVQLPPEALESLSQSEIAAIRNFAVPADGTSAAAPLPALDGTVTGTVFEADGVTPVPSQIGSGFRLNLTLRSNNVLFGRAYTSGADLNGHFRFGPTGDLIGFLGAMTLPVDAFTLTSTHTWTNVASSPTVGNFEPGSNTSTTNHVYSNTAVVKGVVRRHTSAPVAAALITSAGASFGGSYPDSANDGSFVAGGLPPTPVTVTAKMRHPQRVGSVFLTGALNVTAAAGQVLAHDLVLEPTGALNGTVRNAAGVVVVNATVDLLVDKAVTTNRLRVTTDSAGVYRFTDVPLGTFTVQTTDPVTQLTKSSTAMIAQDQTSIVDLTFVPVGSVKVTATYTNGQPTAGARVDIQKTILGATFTNAGNTDATGQLTIANVPGGGFIVRVHRPVDVATLTTVDIAGTVTAQGEVVPVAATVVPLGTVLVQVNGVTGSPVPNAQVQSDARSTSFQSFQTDGGGALTIASVPGRRVFRVRAFDPATGAYRESSAQIATEAQTVTVTVVVGAVGSVSGHVLNANGTPATGLPVEVDSDSPSTVLTTTTDSSGAYAVTGVPTGELRVKVTDVARQLAGSARARIDQHGDSKTTDVSMTDVLLPSTPLDANGFGYRVTAGARLGQNAATEGYASMYSLLAGPSGTLTTTFGGDFSATPELGGRQLSIRDFQNGARQVVASIAGTPLTMTRKIYVPASGYFARYLEIFDNPTASPVVLDLQLTGTLTSTRVVSTSNGDATVQPADLWMVTDKPSAQTTPAVAHAFQGAPARVAPAIAQTTTDFSSRIVPNLQWKGLVVPANGRAILMHFTSQEPDAAAAQAAAERLMHLPPEALAGLTADDASAIVNFTVPADLSSPVAPFATLSGRVVAFDGTTAVPGALVTITGNSSPLFKPSVTVPANASGQYSASTVVAGTITARAIDPNTGLASQVATLALPAGQSSIAQDLTLAPGGALTGIVRLPNGGAAAGASVTIAGGAVPMKPTVGADGRYLVATMPAGTYTVTATLAGRYPVTVGGVAVTVGQTATADLRFGAVATVRVTVRRADGAAVPGAYVYLTDSALTHQPVNANASGVATVTSVAEGAFTLQVRSFDNVAVIGSAAGTIAVADDGRTIDIAVQGTAGIVTGSVFAGDGLTPLPGGVVVQVLDAATGALVAYGIADQNGRYVVPSVTAGASGFRLVATAFGIPGATAQATGTVAPGQTVTIDLTLPVSIVTGTVLLGDGVTPAGIVSVEVLQEDANAEIVSRELSSDDRGRYVAIGLSPGTVEVLAFAPTGLQGTATGTLASSDSVLTLDVRLPATGAVAGTVSDAGGNPIAFADVALSSDGAAIFDDLFASADAAGRFSFTTVPAGRFTVQACGYADSVYQCGSGTATVEHDGDTLTVNVALRALGGSVTGTLRAADGVTPVSGAFVQLRAGEDGPLTSDPDGTSTDASGRFTFAQVPIGVVEAVLDSSSAASGAADNSVGPVSLNLVRGNAVRCRQPLTGSDNFVYDVGCGGELGSGGTTDGELSDAYDAHAYNLRINGATTESTIVAEVEQGGRQLVYGPMQLSGVLATRRVFVPASGGFARYLETITNPAAQAVTVDVQIDMALSGSIHLLVDPAVTNNMYAVTRATQTVDEPRPTLAHVFGGPSAAVAPSSVHFQALTGSSHYTWRVTIPAGGTIALMHFAVQRDSASIAAADAQAQALVSLTDPNALAGMSAADKARVVNFRIE